MRCIFVALHIVLCFSFSWRQWVAAFSVVTCMLTHVNLHIPISDTLNTGQNILLMPGKSIYRYHMTAFLTQGALLSADAQNKMSAILKLNFYIVQNLISYRLSSQKSMLYMYFCLHFLALLCFLVVKYSLTVLLSIHMDIASETIHEPFSNLKDIGHPQTGKLMS